MPLSSAVAPRLTGRSSPSDPELGPSIMKLEKRVQIVLPVKVSPWNEGQKPAFQMACTFDLSQKGARLGGV